MGGGVGWRRRRREAAVVMIRLAYGMESCCNRFQLALTDGMSQ